MTDLSDFPITRRWPATRPDAIQLYAFPTPNGVKVSIALEEMGLDYEPHLVTLKDEDVKSDAFTSLNPNGKIPAIIDPDGPDGRPIGLFESGAILAYLADKTGKLQGENRWHTLQWVMFQMGGVGPMFGQLGWFVKFAGAEIEDKRGRDRYVAEAKRLLGVVEGQLDGQDWIAGREFSIADIALAPWLNALDFYGVKEMVGWDDHPRTKDYVRRFYDRPAVKRAKRIPDPEQAKAA